jgi:hypothetical protein
LKRGVRGDFLNKSPSIPLFKGGAEESFSFTEKLK